MSNGYGSGHKREKLRQYVTQQGVRIPIGNSSLTVSADPIAKSAKATLDVPIGSSSLTVSGGVDPVQKSVGVQFKGPLPQRGIKKKSRKKKRK